MNLLTCPPDDRLQRYSLGRLSEADATELDAHLVACAPCVGRLDRLPDGPDDLVREMRGLGGRRPPRNPVLDQLRQRLHALPGPAAGEVTTDVNTRTAAQQAATGPLDVKALLAPAEQPDELGRLGPYRMRQVLGIGGMGVVFLAEDTRLQRPVALKVLRPELSANPDFRQRFLREARMAAQLQHDHIVTIYLADEVGGVPLVAMQLLEGETLEQRLQRDGKLPVAEVLRVGREVAAGLQAAHAGGLIHRDIKPANLWLERDSGRVKVLDFGLARPAADDDGQLTQTGTVLGTPAYMAPEQAEGQPLDGRCDLFSLGCVLYRMATGVPAFQGKTPLAVMKAVTTEEPRPAKLVNPDVPAALSELIQRLLAKDPNDRPTSAQGVVDMLATLEKSPRTSGRRAAFAKPAAPTPLQPEAPPPGRGRPRRWLVPAVAACLLALAAGGWLLRSALFPVDPGSPDQGKPANPGDQGQTRVSPPLSLMSLVSAPAVIKGLKGWDLETKADPEPLRVSFSPDGRYMSLWANNVVLRGSWDFTKGTLVPAETYAPPVPPGVHHALAPDGKVLARIKGNTVELLEPGAAKADFTVRGLSQPTDILFSPDSKLLVIATGDNGVVIVDANGRHKNHFLKDFQIVWLIGWLPDGASLVMGIGSPGTPMMVFANVHDGSIRKDYPAGLLTAVVHQKHKPAVLAADGKWLAVHAGDHDVVVRELPGGKVKHRFKDISGAFDSGLVPSPDRKYLAYQTKDFGLAVVEVATGKVKTFRGYHRAIYDFAFSPDRKIVVASGHDGVVRLWSVATGRQLGTLLSFPSGDWLAISPDGHYRASPKMKTEDTLVYVAEPPAGKVRQFSPAEFAKEYGWKNQPERVLLTEAATGRLLLEPIVEKK